MATTVTQAFAKLKSNMEITGLQESTVSTRQQNVRAAIESDLEVLDSFLTGSYSRHTMIAPLNEVDIDIFIVLHPDYYQTDGQAYLLDKVKTVLKKTYPRTPDISRNGQAVTIRFDDFAVDVVPSFYRQGGGYLIPNSVRRTWIATDPNKHVEIMSNANAVTVVWYNIFTGLIAEVDMAMSRDLVWFQTNLPAGTDPDNASGDPSFYDVQNIATHEAGHWLMLGDLYNKPATEETMYGYGAKGELKKRSLESGDLAGLQTIYSGATKP